MAVHEKAHRVGVIGLGAIGKVTLANMAEHADFAVVNAWDPDGDACAWARDAFPDVEIADGPDDLISDARTTVVYIATPPNSHASYVRATAKAGKGVYCEKPLGVDLAESVEVVALVERAGLPSAVNFNHGNATASTFVEQQLRLGAMGDVAGVDIFIHLSGWPREFQRHAGWLAGRAQGGFTREMLSHWFYLTRRLLGEGTIESRSVRFPADPGLAETRVLAELAFGGVPTIVNAACGGAGPVGTEYTIWGSQRSYRLHSGGRISASDGGPWTALFDDVEDLGRQDQMRNLDAAALRFAGEPVALPDLRDGFAVQQLIEALLVGA